MCDERRGHYCGEVSPSAPGIEVGERSREKSGGSIPVAAAGCSPNRVSSSLASRAARARRRLAENVRMATRRPAGTALRSSTPRGNVCDWHCRWMYPGGGSGCTGRVSSGGGRDRAAASRAEGLARPCASRRRGRGHGPRTPRRQAQRHRDHAPARTADRRRPAESTTTRQSTHGARSTTGVRDGRCLGLRDERT